jgi:uncharacterized protein with HEPN domain
MNDTLIQDAVVRRLEIIGEAVKNISEKTKGNYPEIKWKNIAGTRNAITHGYFQVDLERVWGIIKNGLQKLKKQIEQVKKDLENK